MSTAALSAMPKAGLSTMPMAALSAMPTASCRVIARPCPRARCIRTTQRRAGSSSPSHALCALSRRPGSRSRATASALDAAVNGALARQLPVAFPSTRKAGDVRVFYNLTDRVKRVAVVVVPDKEAEGTRTAINYREHIRRAAGAATRALRDVGASHVLIEPLGNELPAAAEGAIVGSFGMADLKTAVSKTGKEIKSVGPLFSDKADMERLAWPFARAAMGAEAQNLARWLAERPANLMTPRDFANQAQSLLTPLQGVRMRIGAGSRFLRSQRMNAFQAVASGSAQAPRFLEIRYQGAAQDVPSICLVGKGITFDSGGISLKPATNMALMKGDMTGAACVLASVHAIARMRRPVNVIALIPLCENMPGNHAVKPGDVVRARNGVSIEIDNTDAEGRLILADALSYASELKPQLIVSVATLTGAADVALGFPCLPYFARKHDETALSRLHAAASQSGEYTVSMPFHPDYQKMIQSHVADIVNSTNTKSAGACTAAAFLSYFVPDTIPYCHLDIAGIFHTGSPMGLYEKGMTGLPTRMLIELMQNWGSRRRNEALNSGSGAAAGSSDDGLGAAPMMVPPMPQGSRTEADTFAAVAASGDDRDDDATSSGWIDASARASARSSGSGARPDRRTRRFVRPAPAAASTPAPAAASTPAPAAAPTSSAASSTP